MSCISSATLSTVHVQLFGYPKCAQKAYQNWVHRMPFSHERFINMSRPTFNRFIDKWKHHVWCNKFRPFLHSSSHEIMNNRLSSHYVLSSKTLTLSLGLHPIFHTCGKICCGYGLPTLFHPPSLVQQTFGENRKLCSPSTPFDIPKVSLWRL